jgi:hypothetical protein
MRLSFVMLLLSSGGVLCHGQDVSQCEGALVKTTYQKLTSEHVDLRLASLVTKEIYDEIRHDAGAHAVIYGVPVGANYDDFHKRVETELNQVSTSLTHDQSLNVLWTALDPNSVTAYSKCIEELGDGLTMAVKSATKTDIAVLLRYVPRAGDKREIPLSWSGLTVDKNKRPLPTTLVQGKHTVIVSRPEQQEHLAVNSPGFTGSVILDPLPPPPPPQDRRIIGRWIGTSTYRNPNIKPQTSEATLDVNLDRNGMPVVKVVTGKLSEPTWRASYVGHTLIFIQGNPGQCENLIVLSLNETGQLAGSSSPADDLVTKDPDCLTKTYNQPENIDYAYHKSN